MKKLKFTLKRYIEKNSFSKFLLMFSLISILCLFILGSMLIRNIKHQYAKEIQNKTEDYLFYLESEIFDYYFFTNNIMNELLTNLKLNDEFELLFTGGYEEFFEYRLDRVFSNEGSSLRLDTWFQQVFQRNTNLKKAVFYSKENNNFFLRDEFSIRFSKSLTMNYAYLDDLLGADNNIQTFIVYFAGEYYLVFYVPFKKIDYPDKIGDLFLFFSLPDNPHADSLENSGTVVFLEAINNSTLVYPQENNSIYTNKDKFSTIDLLNKRLRIKTYQKINYDSVQNSISLTLVIIFSLIGIAILSAYLFLKEFFSRIQILIGAMGEVKKGNLDIRIDNQGKQDEIAIIGEVFNQMCGDLNNHIEKSYIFKLKQKSTELKALQNQIQPHFLYNTLEAIRMKAIADGSKQTGDMIYHLGALFRHQLNNSMILPVEKELDFCFSFLTLYQMRYKDALTIENNIPREVLNYKILKLSLQPIVENYMLYGFDPERADNKILFSGGIDEDKFTIIIEDNGNKIEDKKLSSINFRLKHLIYDGNASIGLYNVNKRLKTAFGDKATVVLKNNIQGVTVTVSVPISEDVCIK